MEPSVIANSAKTSNISHHEIVNIFTRKQSHWSDGHKITVYTKVLNSIEHKMFAINILNLSLFKYKSLLDSSIYSGTNSSVIELSSDEEMMSKLSNTPYSIGYVNYHVIINDNTSLINVLYD